MVCDMFERIRTLSSEGSVGNSEHRCHEIAADGLRARAIGKCTCDGLFPEHPVTNSLQRLRIELWRPTASLVSIQLAASTATILSQPSKHGAQVHTHRPSQRSRAFSCLHTRDGALSHLLQSLVIQSSPISIHGVDSIARRRSVTYATRSGSGRASASNCMCMKACASWLKRSDSSAPPSRGSVSTESPP